MFVICLFDHVGSFRDMLVPRMVSTFQEMCNLSTLEIMSDPEFFEPKTDVSESVAYISFPLSFMISFFLGAEISTDLLVDCCLSCSVLGLIWDIADCKTLILFINLRK